MYKDEFKLLTPAQRLERVRATLETRMASWESSLYNSTKSSSRATIRAAN